MAGLAADGTEMDKRIFSTRKHTVGERVADVISVLVIGGVVVAVLAVGLSHLI